MRRAEQADIEMLLFFLNGPHAEEPAGGGVSKHALGPRMLEFWVYILRCGDGSYYVGSARGGLERRIAEHRTGAFGGYTAARLPVTLVYSQPFQRITDAVAAERQIKGWSRAKKEALIAGRYDLLPALASRKRS
jgi:putative endonuclease